MFLTVAVAALMIVVGVVVVTNDGSEGMVDCDDGHIMELMESSGSSMFPLEGSIELSRDVYISGQITIFEGELLIGPGLKLEISESGSLTIGGNVTVVNNGSIENLGTINTEYEVMGSEECYGSIFNNGYFYNDGVVVNYGKITNKVIDDEIVDESVKCTIVNYNTIENYGTITNNDVFTNHDTFMNNGITINNGKINNNGVFVNAVAKDKFSGSGTLYNYNIMSGEFGCNVVDDGNQFDLLPVTISPGRSTVQAPPSSVVQFTAPVGFPTNEVIRVDIGGMAMAINGGE